MSDPSDPNDKWVKPMTPDHPGWLEPGESTLTFLNRPPDDDPSNEPADPPHKTTVDTRDWIPMPAVDAGDYLDRPMPQYENGQGEDDPMNTIILPSTEERDAVIKEMIQTTTYFDLETGEDYKPTVPPVVYDPEADADEAG